MSQWSQESEQFPISDVLSKFKELLEKIDFKQKTKDEILKIVHIKKIIPYVETILNQTDPDLIIPDFFKSSYSHLNNAFNEFSAYTQNTEIAHLNRSSIHLRRLLSAISNGFLFYKTPTKANLNAIVKAYDKGYEDLLSKYTAISDQKIEETKKILNNVETVAQGLNEIIYENKAYLDVIKIEAVEQDKLIKEGLANLTTKFNDSEKERFQQFQSKEKEFDKVIKHHDEERRNDLSINRGHFKDEMDKYKKEVDTVINDLETKSKKVIKELEERAKKAGVLTNLVAGAVQSDAHNKYADAEKSYANTLRGWGLTCLIVAAIILAIPMVQIIFSNATFDFNDLYKRLPLSLLVFAPAVYLIKESNKHRKNETENRKKALTLITIDTYIETLSTDQRSKLKENVANEIFGNNEKTIGSKNLLEAISDSSESLVEIAKNLLPIGK